MKRMWSRPAAVAEPDPADYGTCIGLEFTLDEMPAAPPAPPARALPGWVRRLAGRTKHGT